MIPRKSERLTDSEIIEMARAEGFEVREFRRDGCIQRFGPKNAQWALGKPEVVIFGDWRTDEKRHYFSSSKPTNADRRQLGIMRRQLDEDQAKRQAEAAAEAERRFEALATTGSSPYLARKGIEAPDGVRFDGENMVVPLRDPGGRLCSLQEIRSGGEKRFFPGGKVAGCFHALGDIEGGAQIFIVEGLATGQSVREATGATVVVAFSAKNLVPVALSLRARFPDLPIMIAGDDDRFSVDNVERPINAGRTCAEEAAQAMGARVAFPRFASEESKPTDFNDLHVREGIDRVREQLAAALTTEGKDQSASYRFSRPLAEFERREVDWLWRSRIPLSCVTTLEGNGGVGKSFVMSAISSAVSSGHALHGSEAGEPRTVLLLAAEDDPVFVLRPRFENHQADLGRIRVHDQAMLLDASGLTALEQEIEEHQVKLVVIDPIVSFLGHKLDMNSATDVRSLMGPLGEIARRQECAIVVVRHWNKSIQASASARGSGSVDFRNASRSVLQVIKTDDANYLCHEKCNLGPLAETLTFSVENGAIRWTGSSPLRPDEILRACAAAQAEETGELEAACDFLRDELSEGPIGSKKLGQSAADFGLSNATLRRAKKTLNVKSFKQPGTGTWLCELPSVDRVGGPHHAHVAQEVQASGPEQVEHLEQVDFDLKVQTPITWEAVL